MAKQNGISAAAFGATLNSGPRDTDPKHTCGRCGEVFFDFPMSVHTCPKPPEKAVHP